MSKDLFSKQADIYAKYRPSYPAELIEFIVQYVEHPVQAWDCATGNGQAAQLLADFFTKVFATDISEKQILQAMPASNIEYSVSKAEQTSFPSDSFDLITVAQAYHWFNFEAFFKEATRVAKNHAVVAVWGYDLLRSQDAKLNELIRYFYFDVVGKYWDAERKHVENHYSSVSFAFQPLPSKEFSIDVQWNRDDLLGYFNTWSSVQHFIKDNNYNPVNELAPRLIEIWPDGEELKQFSFPIFLKVGRIEK